MQSIVAVLALVAILLATLAGVQGSRFKQTVLAGHNFYRAKHGAPALQLDSGLNRFAQDWADHLAQIDYADHNPAREELGENIYVTMTTQYATKEELARNMVRDWYDESRLYDYNRDPLQAGVKVFNKVGHFTQLVWRDTKLIGLGRATSRSGHTYVVANYFPSGNVPKWFRYKVSPPMY